MNLKETLDNAGIRVTEAAELFHVSRATVYDWMNRDERERKSKYLYDSAKKICVFLDKAVALGTLPVKDVTGADRMFAIKSAIRNAAVGNIS